jgi:hypothetical protein
MRLDTMRTALILASVLLASGAAAQQPKPVALLGPHLVCATIAQAALLYENPKDHERLGDTFLKDRTCVVLPPGTKVYAQETQGVFTCLRPIELTTCAWTVLVERQAREFRKAR